MEISTGIAAVIALLGGLFGVLVGAHLSYRSTCIIEKRKQTSDLFLIYNSSEFTRVRNEAGITLRNNLGRGEGDSWDELHKRLKDTGEWEKISKVDHYFRSIYFLSQDNLIDNKLARALFRETHNYWFGRYFSVIDHASGKKNTGTQSKLNRWLNKT